MTDWWPDLSKRILSPLRSEDQNLEDVSHFLIAIVDTGSKWCYLPKMAEPISQEIYLHVHVQNHISDGVFSMLIWNGWKCEFQTWIMRKNSTLQEKTTPKGAVHSSFLCNCSSKFSVNLSCCCAVQDEMPVCNRRDQRDKSEWPLR